MITKAELVLDAKSDLGEGPGWDADTKLPYHFIGSTSGSCSLAQSGGMMLALQNGFYELDIIKIKIA